MKVSRIELKECITEALTMAISENLAQKLSFDDLDAQLSAILDSDPKARSARRAANVDGNLGLSQIKDKKEQTPPEAKRGRGRPKKGEEKPKEQPKSAFSVNDDSDMLAQIGVEQEKGEQQQQAIDMADAAQDYGNSEEDNEEQFDSETSSRSSEELIQERNKWIAQAQANNSILDNIRPYRRVNSEINRRLKMKCEFAEFECEPMVGYKMDKNLILRNLKKDGIDVNKIRVNSEDRDVPILSTSNVKLYPGEVEPTWKNFATSNGDNAYMPGMEDTNDLNFSMRMGKDKEDPNDINWKPNRYWQ